MPNIVGNVGLQAILIEVRKQLGATTQVEFADAIGVRQSTISRLWRSNRMPRRLYLKIKTAGITQNLLKQLQPFVLSDEPNQVRW